MFKVEVRVQDQHEVYEEHTFEFATPEQVFEWIARGLLGQDLSVTYNIIPVALYPSCSMFLHPCERGEAQHQWAAVDEGDAENGPPARVEVRCQVCGAFQA